jgi:hypothetical protein
MLVVKWLKRFPKSSQPLTTELKLGVNEKEVS